MRELIERLSELLSPRERVQAVGLLCLMVGGTTLELLGIGAIPAFVSILSNPEALDRVPVLGSFIAGAGLDRPASLVLGGAAGLLGLFITKNLYLAAQAWGTARYVFNRQVGIAQRLLRRYLYSPYTFHLQRNSAELLRNSNQDAMEVVGAGLMPLMNLAKETLTVTAVLGLLLWVEPVTSLVAFVILGGTVGLFLRLMRRRTLALGQQMHESRMHMIQAVNEGLGGIKVTRVLGREEDFFRAFARASDSYSRAGRGRQMLGEVPRLVLETAGIAGLLGVAALLTVQGRPVTALIPTLTLLAVAVVRMIPSFNAIMAALNAIRYGRYSVDAVYRDLMTPEPASESSAPLAFNDTIRLEDVTYRYPNAQNPTLRNVSMSIRRGEAIGFVGPTGSGKTTLVDVILGLLNPTSGRLMVDGVDVGTRTRAWQRQIGYVPQEIYLTDDTIRRNVAFGVAPEEIDDASVTRALQAAQALEFINALPDEVNTVVGERGVRLSGGQRQRIGIARALYHDPAVLVLDEATSALDRETEGAVMEAVEALHGSRTILMIAHRLSTVAACDRVIVVRNGLILDQESEALQR